MEWVVSSINLVNSVFLWSLKLNTVLINKDSIGKDFVSLLQLIGGKCSLVAQIFMDFEQISDRS